MSADNTILIIKTKRTAKEISKGVWQNGDENYVYRVAEVRNAEQLDYCKHHELHNLGVYLYTNFKDSPVFHEEAAAEAYAEQMESEIENAHGYVEYGIHTEDLSEYVFWGDL